MTWIVGMPTMWGYSFGLSDVRVTLANGEEIDCLQKIHQVGQYVAAGFAGSVHIGFAMLETLHRVLYLEDVNQAWDPIAISEWWPRLARDVFALFPEQEKALHSHLLMLSTHPTENSGAEWPQSHGFIFRSPDFMPTAIKVHKPDSIGSGNGVVECKSAIDRLSNDFDAMFAVMKGEQGVHGGMGTHLGFNLTRLLKEIRPAGISAHLNYCWAYRGQIIIKTNDHSTEGAWTVSDIGSGYGRSLDQPRSLDVAGLGGKQFQMPLLAASWDQLVAFLKENGGSAVGCVS